MDSFNFTVTAETASNLRDWFDEQNREFIEDLLDGKGQFTLEHGDRKVIVAPVKHGRWEATVGGVYCSECADAWSNEVESMIRSFNYCPNCGARMEEQE